MATSWADDFSFDYYRSLLRELADGYIFSSFKESPNCIDGQYDKPVVLLRHDVDLDLHKALEMAKLEWQYGISACYMFLDRCPFYSLEDDSVVDIICSIRGMGHEIGLHYDVHNQTDMIDGDAVDETANIRASLARLEKAIAAPVSTLSFHRPLPDYIRGELYVEGRVNAYAGDLMRWYLSDSKGRWREGEPLLLLQRPRGRLLQLLVHPIWWGCEHIVAERRLQQFFERKTDGLSEIETENFDRQLAKHLTLQRSGIAG